MKQFLLAAVFAAAAAPALAADPVWGMWQTQVDDGAFAFVELKGCADPAKTCGWEMRSFHADGSEYRSEFIGKQLVIDMANIGGGKYKGKVWRPSNGKTYIGKMKLKGDSLDLVGCVLGGLFCASQTWTRVK